MIVHEWLERRVRWPLFLGAIGFFGGFLYFASGWGAAAVMVGVIVYPLAMACFNRTEIWVDGERLRWRFVPVYCKKSGDVRLEEITHVFYGETVSKESGRRKNSSDAPRFVAGIARSNGKRNKLVSGFLTLEEAKDYGSRIAALAGKRVEAA
jgi:hypothetical protein